MKKILIESWSKMIEHKKILVLGMARSGVSVAKLLARFNNDIIITDLKEQERDLVEELEALGIKVHITDKQEDLVDESFDIVIKNPAIRKDNFAVLRAKNLGILVVNEVEVAFKFLPENVSVIGITGSNGKTTTTTIVYELLKSTGRNVFLGGNIGIPFSSFVLDIKSGDILVLEISDHQLCDMYDFKANISALTNLSEVHIDFHGTYEQYKKTKKKIFNNQTKNDLVILNKDNIDVLEVSQDSEAQKIYFSSKEIADVYLKDNEILYKNEVVIQTSDIRVKGIHNYENIMVAIAIAKQYGVTNDNIKKFLSTFNGVEHRIEYVRTLNGRKFYNDSKATNNESTIIALNSFNEDTILIMGGLDRNIPFDSIAPYLKHVTCVFAYGETKDKIREFAHLNHVQAISVDHLKEAIFKAYEMSKEGDIILLSPACASWDQYKDFEERGNEFKEVVNSLR